MMRAVKWLLNLLFPPRCPLCRKILPGNETTVCNECLENLPENTLEISIDGAGKCTAPVRYEGAVRKAVIRYKFQSIRCYAPAFAQLMFPMAEAAKAEIVTWIPVSGKRLRERGYDQAELLARAVSKHLNIPCEPLLNKKHTKKQSATADKAERRANILNAFIVPEPQKAAEKTILLIDDICTTGATLSEASRVLLLAGAAEVKCLTFAMTPEYRNNR